MSITDDGKVELDAPTAQMSHTEAKALAVLSDAERETISQAFDKVYDAYVRTANGD
uniref:hypothetical protein n=1 Tax=Sphingomonas bacterium TaxID=1895847 RepID=UPI002604FED6|nr:hypothetical protein [Sphingomonas bacterium]